MNALINFLDWALVRFLIVAYPFIAGMGLMAVADVMGWM